MAQVTETSILRYGFRAAGAVFIYVFHAFIFFIVTTYTTIFIARIWFPDYDEDKVWSICAAGFAVDMTRPLVDRIYKKVVVEKLWPEDHKDKDE